MNPTAPCGLAALVFGGFILLVPPPMLNDQNAVDRHAPRARWLEYSIDQSLIENGTGQPKEFRSVQECRAEAKRRAEFWKTMGFDVVEQEFRLGKCIPLK